MTLGELLDADWRRLAEKTGSRPARSFLASFSPRFAPVVLVRCAQRLHARGWRQLSKMFALLNFLIFGIEVPPRLEIGPGLIIPHTHGTILGAASIGANATIYQQVTLGAKLSDFVYDAATRPVVEDDVTITAGAKILGAIRIGQGATIGANAVVLADVPAGAIAVGVPARIITTASTRTGKGPSEGGSGAS